MIDFSREVQERFLLQQEYLGTNKTVNHTKPLVSVSVATYQHVHFIEQCLDGILAQETDFPYEIIVGEDGSVDGTRDICIKYAINHPDKIRLFLRDRNTTTLMHENRQIRFNGIFCRMSCRGKYIALCEGDDYWTDPHKLQKQVEFLEAHPECSMCFHWTDRLIQATGVIETTNWTGRRKPYYTLEDILHNKIHIPTLSVMFHSCLVRDLPGWFFEVPVGDWPLFILLAQHGKIGLLDQTMSVYRVHAGGAWSGVDKARRDQMGNNVSEAVQKHLGPQYQRHFAIGTSNRHITEAANYADQGDIHNAKVSLSRSLRSSFSFQGPWIDQLVMLTRLYLPQMYLTAKQLLK